MTYLPPRLRARLFGSRAGRVSVSAVPITGGLEAAAIHLVTVTAGRSGGERVAHRYVHKIGRGFAAREAAIYARVVEAHGLTFAPRVLAVERPAPRTVILFLEAVTPRHRWPWAELESPAGVLERLAALHTLPAPRPLPPWDYDADLAACARETIALLRRLAAQPATSALARNAIPAAEEFAEQLGAARRALLEARPLGACVIHGDAHPGNVIERSPADPVLIDWARARVGSPFEDVSSWLQTLAYWEPEVRRRHDTLLARYLSARGLRAELTRELRDLYWLAAACNAFSGALVYHLLVASTSADRDAAGRSADYARDWIRILRRARARLC